MEGGCAVSANVLNGLHGEGFKHCTESHLNITRRGYLTAQGEHARIKRRGGCAVWRNILRKSFKSVTERFLLPPKRQFLGTP